MEIKKESKTREKKEFIRDMINYSLVSPSSAFIWIFSPLGKGFFSKICNLREMLTKFNVDREKSTKRGRRHWKWNWCQSKEHQKTASGRGLNCLGNKVSPLKKINLRVGCLKIYLSDDYLHSVGQPDGLLLLLLLLLNLRLSKWMNEWMNEWMDGWIDE